MTEITIDRPNQMNTFTADMARSFQRKIHKLDENPHMKVIFIKKAEGPAFCAGGDLKSIMKSPNASENNYQHDINKLVLTMSELKATTIAFLDGIVMGTGVGMSHFAKIKIATENTLLAMPESKLGYITDVGSGWYLPRLRSGIGLYMMLTGASIKGEDVVKIGMAHYYVPSAKLEQLQNELREFVANNRADNVNETSMRKIIEKYHESFSKEFKLEKLILEHFEGKNSVEEVLESLERIAGKDKQAAKILDVLKQNSPISLKTNFELHKRGKNMTLEEVLTLELSLGEKLMKHGDIIRGVKKVLLKQESEWGNKNVHEIKEEEVQQMFEIEKKQSLR